jgi:hypothetical protein
MQVDIFCSESAPVNPVFAELYVPSDDPILLLAVAVVGGDTERR